MSNRNAVACAAIICKHGKVLARKSTLEPNANMWEFPGGMLKPSEDSLAACRRTIADQFGCRLSTAWKLDTIDFETSNCALRIDCFVCMLVPGTETTPKGVDEVRWLGPNELLEVEWCPQHKEAVGLVGKYWDQLFFSEHL